MFLLQLLPLKLLEENRKRNIQALTFNQLSVIYKLIWYQDGYEQPSEEDLRRIMVVGVLLCDYNELLINADAHFAEFQRRERRPA